MTKRQHVVRTDDRAGTGTSRSLGSCEILCARDDGGEVQGGDQALVAPITVYAGQDYQRCFVAATVGAAGPSTPVGSPRSALWYFAGQMATETVTSTSFTVTDQWTDVHLTSSLSFHSSGGTIHVERQAGASWIALATVAVAAGDVADRDLPNLEVGDTIRVRLTNWPEAYVGHLRIEGISLQDSISLNSEPLGRGGIIKGYNQSESVPATPSDTGWYSRTSGYLDTAMHTFTFFVTLAFENDCRGGEIHLRYHAPPYPPLTAATTVGVIAVPAMTAGSVFYGTTVPSLTPADDGEIAFFFNPLANDLIPSETEQTTSGDYLSGVGFSLAYSGLTGFSSLGVGWEEVGLPIP
jgi:hypothetical protein